MLLVLGIEQRTSRALYEHCRAAFDQPGSNILVFVSFQPFSSRFWQLRASQQLNTREIPI